jgi:hypothetical protein
VGTPPEKHPLLIVSEVAMTGTGITDMCMGAHLENCPRMIVPGPGNADMFMGAPPGKHSCLDIFQPS